MAVKSITGGWRAMSLAASADLTATVAGALQLLPMVGTDLMEPEPETFYTNSDEITGQLVPTKHLLLNRKFAGKYKA